MIDGKDGVSPEETEIEETDEEAEEEFNAFDEVDEEYKPSRLNKVMGEDGLPTQDAEFVGSDIPPLALETLICMGDFSSFVKRDAVGEIIATYGTDDVHQMPDGSFRLKEKDPGQAFGEGVLPIRPPCVHYVRQLGLGSGEMKFHYRLCSARRTTEGAFMSVRDTGMWACSMREPRHLESERVYLDMFDEKKTQQGKQRVVGSIFKDE